MTFLRDPFIGTEALASAALSRHQLRTSYRAVFPDVYLAKATPLSLHHRIVAAWLWSRRRATVAGLSAAALHGATWIDDDIVIELVHTNPKAPSGIYTRRMVLIDGERQHTRYGLPVTDPVRTAFHLARQGREQHAVARLDALVRATGLPVDDVADLARRHPGARGLRRMDAVLDLVDAGAQSPKETWLRLLLVSAGLPRPRTQIPVLGLDGVPFAYLDLGWEDCMVAVEYDGEHHQTGRSVYTNDIRRAERIEQRGWLMVRVVKEDHPVDIVRRVRRARRSRGANVA